MLIKAANYFKSVPGTVYVVVYVNGPKNARGVFKTLKGANNMRDGARIGGPLEVRVGRFRPDGDIDTI
jgi:hypothetical protein